MTTELLITLFATHWIGDFVGQTQKEGEGKSSSWGVLMTHTTKYMSFFIPLMAYLCLTQQINYASAVMFLCITLVSHTLTDATTSRVTKMCYESKQMYGWGGFWFWIGLDQLLHAIQLIYTLKYVTK